mmetsp:Transcript_41601/g.137044  ORF Transcript_41601/g.137044 Transcript_41601/m.137044 type:complete len:301 (+) Transcript_41601:4317-5219(+)
MHEKDLRDVRERILGAGAVHSRQDRRRRAAGPGPDLDYAQQLARGKLPLDGLHRGLHAAVVVGAGNGSLVHGQDKIQGAAREEQVLVGDAVVSREDIAQRGAAALGKNRLGPIRAVLTAKLFDGEAAGGRWLRLAPLEERLVVPLDHVGTIKPVDRIGNVLLAKAFHRHALAQERVEIERGVCLGHVIPEPLDERLRVDRKAVGVAGGNQPRDQERLTADRRLGLDRWPRREAKHVSRVERQLVHLEAIDEHRLAILHACRRAIQVQAPQGQLRQLLLHCAGQANEARVRAAGRARLARW